mmetsp:Transcript_63978/g.167526  ORF Transcript_63978/g.167526 Transcript_63978/m.167526 type:complete len:93 (-) Transcript_63978:113-391(-)
MQVAHVHKVDQGSVADEPTHPARQVIGAIGFMVSLTTPCVVVGALGAAVVVPVVVVVDLEVVIGATVDLPVVVYVWFGVNSGARSVVVTTIT